MITYAIRFVSIVLCAFAILAGPPAVQASVSIYVGKNLTKDHSVLLAGFGDELERLVRSYKKAGYDGALAFESIGEGDLLAPLPKAREVVEAAIRKIEKEN